MQLRPHRLGTNRLVKLVKEHQANFAGIGSLIVRDLRQAVAHAGTAPALARHGGDIEHEQFEPRGICHGLDGVGFSRAGGTHHQNGSGRKNVARVGAVCQHHAAVDLKAQRRHKGSKLPSWPITL